MLFYTVLKFEPPDKIWAKMYWGAVHEMIMHTFMKNLEIHLGKL